MVTTCNTCCTLYILLGWKKWNGPAQVAAENVSWLRRVSEATGQRLVGSKWRMRRLITLQKQWRGSLFSTHHKQKKGKIWNLSIHKLWYFPFSFCMRTIQKTFAQSLSLHFTQYLQQVFYKSYGGWLGKWVQQPEGTGHKGKWQCRNTTLLPWGKICSRRVDQHPV